MTEGAPVVIAGVMYVTAVNQLDQDISSREDYRYLLPAEICARLSPDRG